MHCLQTNVFERRQKAFQNQKDRHAKNLPGLPNYWFKGARATIQRKQKVTWLMTT